MKLKGTRYDVDGSTREVEIDSSCYVKSAREALGGEGVVYAELVRPAYAQDKVFLCDENGHQKGLPVNPKGCEMYLGPGRSGPAVVGPIVVFDKAAFMNFDEHIE